MTESDQRVLVRSELLGEFEVSPEQLIDFSRGLPGFPEGHTYALLAAGREGVFWLQSLQYSALSFLLLDPFQFFPGYVLDLTEEDFTRLGTSNPSELLVLAIVTLGASPDQGATANLRAPILVNLHDRTALQSIRADGTHGVREPLDTGTLAA